MLERAAQPCVAGLAMDVARVMAGAPAPPDPASRVARPPHGRCRDDCLQRLLPPAPTREATPVVMPLHAQIVWPTPVSELGPPAATPCCAGTRQLGVAVGGVIFPMPPLLMLFQQSALVWLSWNIGAYCSTQAGSCSCRLPCAQAVRLPCLATLVDPQGPDPHG